MIRRTLNIGNYQYLLDLFSIEEDNMVYVKKKFIMLRNFTFINNITSDTNIFIMGHDTWKEMCQDLDDQPDNYYPTTTHIVFPIISKKIDGFTNSPMEYNSNFTKDSLYKKTEDGKFEYGKDIYPLLDSHGNMKDIPCNLLRLYHPNNKLKLNAIICIENYINNIHFYYLCKPLNNYKVYSETEFVVNNHIYSEYLEIYFPNLNELYKLVDNTSNTDLYNVYFNENMNTVVSTKNEIFLSRMIQSDEGLEKYTKYYLEHEDIDEPEPKYLVFRDQYVPLNLLLQPFQIVEDIDPYTNDTYNVKIYLKNRISLENNYISNPFNVQIWPYSGIDLETNNYVLDENLTTANTSYSIEYKFSIISKLGFDSSHKISIISKFDYPNRKEYIKYNNNNTALAFQHAYKYYYNINEDNYKYYWVNKLRIDFPEKVYPMLQEFETLFNKQKINDGTENYWYKRQYVDEEGELIWESLDDLSEDEQLRRMIEVNWDGIFEELKDPEVEEDFETGMDFLGFKIQIATDPRYKNLIYNKTITTNFDQLDDFSFNIDGIFDSWNEMPDFLIARTIFIDRIVSRVMVGNSVIISKEFFKYIINQNNVYSINLLNYYNNAMKEIEYKNSNANDMFNEYTNSIEEMNKLFFKDLNKKLNDISISNSYIGQFDENTYIGINNIKNMIDEYSQKLKIVNNIFKENYFSKYIPFNFVNNINCIVNKPQNNLSNIDKDYQQKIIYKPIFFRTQELQNIRLRNNVNQKIGINLVNYMTKVNTFKLVLDGIEFVENSRNDIYVIFEVNSNMLVTSSGKYNIVTQDDEYISSGNWILY